METVSVKTKPDKTKEVTKKNPIYKPATANSRQPVNKMGAHHARFSSILLKEGYKKR